MKVRVIFIHPTKGVNDATIEYASCVEDVVNKLNEVGCSVLSVEEEK